MSVNSSSTFSIIGGGRAGASLAYYLQRNGFKIDLLVENNPERVAFLEGKLQWRFLHSEIDSSKLSQSRILLLTVHDNQVADLAARLAQLDISFRDKIVAHSSGVLPSSALQPLKDRGAAIAGVHPVYSFSSDPRENHGIGDVWFNLEGDISAQEHLENILHSLKNKTLRVTAEQKRAIHLACVFYANFYVSLAEVSKEILQDVLPAASDMPRMLNPLLLSSIENVQLHGVSGGLTGPVKRADTETILSHLDLLEANFPEFKDIYILLSKILVPISGLSDHEKERVTRLLEDRMESAKSNLRR